jgi:hypothetical protein
MSADLLNQMPPNKHAAGQSARYAHFAADAGRYMPQTNIVTRLVIRFPPKPAVAAKLAQGPLPGEEH